MQERESVGLLHGDIPYLRIGHGPPLVSVLGLTPDHEVPEGLQRRMALAFATPFAQDFTVLVVNRRRGLRPGQSMSEIAGHLADAIAHDLSEPVFLHGTSTGGSVALQLAVDRPDLVRRLVVVSSACRLGSRGRAMQAEMARLIRAGEPRAAWASMMTGMLPWPLRRPTGPLARWAARLMVPADPTDLLVTLDAEDAFDVEADLPQIMAPTLVVGGRSDAFYSPELFHRTAQGVPDGRAHIFEKWGHARASTSTATTHLTLGFMLAGAPASSPNSPPARPD
ncbi:alpha/beta fold hydrolase [Nocardioides sp. NPDC057767]|uniref:alpha/beta fold hydrolase n=1 Tax=unclassified Nocardioides TaxID=2615069 RepID=UPI00366DBEA9